LFLLITHLGGSVLCQQTRFDNSLMNLG